MKEKNVLVQKIVEGIQERKGKKITVVNLSKLDAPARYFVLCEGTSNTQILAITESVKVYVREQTGESPFATDGINNALWIAMDYGDVMVHIFERETRQFYNLEHLWSDAKLTDVPDME
jgi:ribosome-associated protein